ncbi:hypothetical protein [Salinibius halmophilus]|uniref:hypothetical protein n=1 Tax=Salinibius halmophilus TaxID=1853216 RepID=UPI000E67284A|nr:hypothetical protein [Salinibius halmophilus]
MKNLVTAATFAFLLVGCSDTGDQTMSVGQGGANAGAQPVLQPKTGKIIELPLTATPDCHFTVLSSTGSDKFGPYLSLSSDQCGVARTVPRKVKVVPTKVEGDLSGLEITRAYISETSTYSTYLFVEASNNTGDVYCNELNYQLSTDDDKYHYGLNTLNNSFEFLSEYHLCVSANESVVFYSSIWRSDIESIDGITLTVYPVWNDIVYSPSPRALQSIERISDTQAVVRYSINPANVVQGWNPKALIQDASGYFVEVADITTDRVIAYSNANAAYEANATELFNVLQPKDKIYFDPDFLPVRFDPLQ